MKKTFFFDFDGTLCADLFFVDDKFLSHTNKDFIKYAIENPNVYDDSSPVPFIKKFVTEVKSFGHECFCLTMDKISISYDSKRKFIDSWYSEITDVFSVCDAHAKIDFIKHYAKVHNLDLKDCVLIEDTYPTVMEAGAAGISAWHVSQIALWESGAIPMDTLLA